MTTKGKHHKVPGNYRDMAFIKRENAERVVEHLKEKASPNVKFEIREAIHTEYGDVKKKVYRVWWSV